MKHGSQLLALIAAIFLAAIPRTPPANGSLPRSTPEAQGISSQAICEFAEALDKINPMHSFVACRMAT